MGIGLVIRRLFGRHEHTLSEIYRSIYVDLNAYADQVEAWVPNPKLILEVGCGEGAVTERLASRYPTADILAIDITPQVGRLFQGPSDRVTFKETTVQEMAFRQPGTFDLAIISDVIHHVPQEDRIAILEATRRAMTPNGLVVFKDWESTNSPIHWLSYCSDRWITGDRVRYLLKGEADVMMTQVFGEGSVIAEARISPWKNNFTMLMRV